MNRTPRSPFLTRSLRAAARQPLLVAVVLAAGAAAMPALAQQATHPALASRAAAAAPARYDYASQFYAHPAGLALAPTYHVRAGGEHPAVLVARAAQQQRAYDYAAQFYAHPARLALDASYEPAALVARSNAQAQPAR